VVCAEADDRPEATLRSLREQTRAPDETVVLCDAATGSLARRVHDELAGRGRVLCARGPLRGAPGRNVGVQVTAGALVALLEPGVVLAPDLLERLAGAFSDPRVGLAAGGVELAGAAAGRPLARGAFLSRARRPLDAALPAEADLRPILATPPEVGVFARAMLEDVADEGSPFDEALDRGYCALELGWRAWRAGWTGVIDPEARAILAEPAPQPAGSEPAARAIASRHLALLRHDRPSGWLLDGPWVLCGELQAHAAVLRRRPALLVQLLREGTVARRRARARRRTDASREGCWGRWRTTVPPRGAWRLSRPSSPDASGGSP
jgi:GT2 family glycosyltransferase